ncbi:hypothetical protein L3Y34_005818 [Caenorhabditis briggsae]|uniref:Uncharacterized protein n=2 Tax=Caenorhabditis briggsae TaxID=6238 RepID=A0AAE9IMJ3_CAEBR|nr:hypothetical protein L3Y34_005818 [Caenorhabditis briggsae]
MRRTIFPVFLVVFLLKRHVSGYASAPGTYPEEEMKAGNDLEVPKNPYQSAWTGYEFYYEKESKKNPAYVDSGKMPAFQSIEEVSSDRESPADPQNLAYQASGSEGRSSTKHTSTSVAPESVEEKVTEKVLVSPSSSIKGKCFILYLQQCDSLLHFFTSVTCHLSTDVPVTTIAPIFTNVTVSTSPTPSLSSNPPSPIDPESGSDELAADQTLYGGDQESNEKKEAEKDSITTIPPPLVFSPKLSMSRDPPPPSSTPRNLLTMLIEKKNGDTAEDSHESGYEPGNPKNSKWSEKKGRAPGTEPKSAGDHKSFILNTAEQTGYENSLEKSLTPSFASQDTNQSTAYSGYPENIGSSKSSPKADPINAESSESSGYPGSFGTSPQPPDSFRGAPQEKPSLKAVPTAFSRNSINPEITEMSLISSTVSYEATTPTTTVPSDSDDYAQNEPQANPLVPESSRIYPTQETQPSPPKQPPTLQPYSNPSIPNLNHHSVSQELHGETLIPEAQIDYGTIPSDPIRLENYSNPVTSNHGNSPGSEPSLERPAPQSVISHISDVVNYNNHIDKLPKPTSPIIENAWNYRNSNNAISARDPYDHFGTARHHPAPPSPHQSLSQKHFTHGSFEEDPSDEMDGGYDNNDVIVVPLRSSASSSHSTASTTSNTEVRAQISEIDRIAESFENSAREPVEYEQKITSESSKGITVEAGKEIMKHLGRKSRKCCSCCDEKQPVSRNIETKADPHHVQQAVDPSRQLGERDPVENYVPLQSTVGGNAYVQQPAAPPPQQTYYQQPFQQYQSQYPQSYPYQQPSSCGCQPQPQNCCAPPAPCCLPTIPCCPPIPCCPQPKICCQPTPICLPPQQCCSINFKLPTIPICGRACPSCPCRRRVHKSLRLKRHAISSSCHQCSAAGEPWKSVLHQHREKRAAPGCSSGFSTVQQNSCGTCGASNLRSPRVKRMGCLPCLGRKKRDTEENSHIRVKRMGCLPCLNGRKKRSALSSGCSQCNSLGHLFNRYKRSLFGCSPCTSQPSCGCQGRKKRSLTVKMVKKAPEQCDATCCDYSRCQNRQKKETLVPFM